MRDDLYFIPMIAAALQEPDPKVALIATFERIRAMGKEPRYQRGYRQLMDFMASAVRGRWEDAAEEVGAMILEALDRPLSAEIAVECDGVVVASCCFEQAVGVQAVGNIKPGAYCLRLDTGRLLWEGELVEKDLLWAKAHPGQDLPMAADTGESFRQPTQRIDLLDGAVVLRVYAGMEFGTLEVEFKNPGSDE